MKNVHIKFEKMTNCIPTAFFNLWYCLHLNVVRTNSALSNNTMRTKPARVSRVREKSSRNNERQHVYWIYLGKTIIKNGMVLNNYHVCSKLLIKNSSFPYLGVV